MEYGLPHTVILDEGELSALRSTLDDLGVPYADNAPAGGSRKTGIPLLITTPARARAFASGEAGEPLPPNFLHLVVAREGEVVDREALKGVLCDFVVQLPIEPDVLRLLTQRAGYGGPERRRMLRVAIGTMITLHTESGSRQAMLNQLSIGGCGLVVDDPPAEGTRVTVEFPKELTAPRNVSVSGRVLGLRRLMHDDSDARDVSVMFDELELGDRVTLRSLMAGQPIDFRPGPSLAVASGAPAAVERAPRRRRSVVPATPERRGARRRLFNRQVLGGSEGLTRIVIGRDISIGGMRAERSANLKVGDELKLAIYGRGDVSPVMLRAEVMRDDGEEGWFLRFEPLSEAVERDFESLLNSLRPMDLPNETGRVLTEVIETE